MLEPKRITSNIKPIITEDLGSGYWYYNYDIKSETIEIPIQDNDKVSKEEIRYNYIQIRVFGKPEYKKCVELLIREFIILTRSNLDFD